MTLSGTEIIRRLYEELEVERKKERIHLRGLQEFYFENLPRGRRIKPIPDQTIFERARELSAVWIRFIFGGKRYGIHQTTRPARSKRRPGLDEALDISDKLVKMESFGSIGTQRDVERALTQFKFQHPRTSSNKKLLWIEELKLKAQQDVRASTNTEPRNIKEYFPNG